MSHTSQRRGLMKSGPFREIIVLAFIPTQFKNMDGIGRAMMDLAITMLRYHPVNWITRNFNEISIPALGRLQGLSEWITRRWPETGRDLLIALVGYTSSVISAVYNDPDDVSALLKEIKGEWLSRNRKKGYPVSIVLSGLPDHVHQCCQINNLTEHTYLHSMGFYGKVKDLPSEEELSLITMCGHGLISVNRVRHLVSGIRAGEMSANGAAYDIAGPCVCGIVNITRAESIFNKLAGSQQLVCEPV